MLDLDHNATTRPHPEVVETMARCFRDAYGNPGSRHAAGRTARKVLETSRESVAEILGAKPGEVVFTSGGTEATNMAIFGLAGGVDVARSTDAPAPVVLLTAGEHPATTESCNRLSQSGWKQQRLDVDSDGRLIPDRFDDLPWNDVRLATVILAHNETGVVQDLTPLIERARSHQVPVHVDAVQAVGKIPVDFAALGATTLCLGAHKFHGPRGVGALLLREGVTLTPYTFGGHQEAGRRAGTECVALVAGMARALELWHADRERITEHVAALRDRLEHGLSEACPPVVVNGSREHRLPNTLNISFPGLDGEALLVALDLEDVGCSLGSTCASGSAEPAPALLAMGKPPEVYQSAVRFSLGIENTAEEIDEAVERISRVVASLRTPQASGRA